MVISEAPKRLHYGWIVVIAFGLLTAGIALWGFYVGPGIAHGGLDLVVVALIFGLFGCSGPLGLWLFVAWLIFAIARSWRFRTWVALMPPAVLVVYVALLAISHPPSAQRYFHKVFEVEMPADAQAIAVRPSTPGDNSTHVAFSSSKASIERLIQTLGMKEEPIAGTHSSYDLQTSHALQREDDGKLLTFWQVEPSSGFGKILITDPQMRHVVVIKDPMFAKTEEQMNGRAP